MNPSALRARAVVVAEAAGGSTRLRTLRSDPPVALRATAGAVYLAASAAGPLGGDEVHVDVSVGAGALLEVRSVAATVVLPGPTPGSSSTVTVAGVGAGGGLRWLPEPTVAVRGCDHRCVARVALAATSSLLWRDELVLGRHGETGGSVLQRLEVDRGGRPLLRTEHALGPRWPGSTGPAGTGGQRAVGTLLAVGAGSRCLRIPPPAAGVRVARAELATDAVVVSAVAGTARAVRAALDHCLAG